VEDPQQSVVRAAAGQEARQRHVPVVRPERRQGVPRMAAGDAAGRRPRGAARVACGAATLGGRPHRPGRRRRRRVRARELPAALPSLSPSRDARMAGVADPAPDVYGCVMNV